VRREFDDQPVFGLRRADQAAVAALVAFALASLAAYWLAAGGRDRLIDIQRAPRRSVDYLVDVNQATWPELAQMPGIGETLARRIVESRETAGPFLDHGDLERVRGIGPRTLERIKPYLLPLPENSAIVGR